MTGIPFPGVPLDPAPASVYLSQVGVDVPSLDPLTIGGTATFGFLPIPPSSYTVSLFSELKASFGNPVTFSLFGEASLFSLPVAHATLTYKVPSTVTVTGGADYKFGPAHLVGKLGGIFDPEHDTYGGSVDATIDVDLGFGIPTITAGRIALAFNNVGVGGCYAGPPLIFGAEVYASYDWDTGDGDAGLGCHIAKFKVGVPTGKVQVRGKHGKLQAASAYGFDIPAGQKVTYLKVHGDATAPNLVFTAPDGSTVTPNSTSVLLFANNDLKVSNVVLMGVPTGHWSVHEADGSPAAVTGIESAAQGAKPSVSGAVSGKGATRTLKYKAKLPAGYSVRFLEQATMAPIGKAQTKSSGSIKFRPATTGGSKRTVIAEIARPDGMPESQPKIATFSAPKAAKLGKVTKLKVTVKRGKFTVSFKRAANATGHLVVFTGGDGRKVSTLLRGKKASITFPVNGYSETASVTVTPISSTGAKGKAAKAKTAKPKKK